MFKLDSPFMNFLNKVCDIMILNFMVVLFSLPIVTAGASITAAYYMSFKMVRNEESYITKGFLKSFKENFKQSTIIWLIILVVAAILVADYRIVFYSGMEFDRWVMMGLLAVTIIIIMGVIFIFPMQARFSNTVKNTIKNAFLMALSHLPSAALFIVAYAIPVVLLYFLPQAAPAVVLLIFGAFPYFKSFLFLRIFRKYEEALLARDAEMTENDTVDSEIFAESEILEKETEKDLETAEIKEK